MSSAAVARAARLQLRDRPRPARCRIAATRSPIGRRRQWPWPDRAAEEDRNRSVTEPQAAGATLDASRATAPAVFGIRATPYFGRPARRAVLSWT
jgi:hypothetical protein